MKTCQRQTEKKQKLRNIRQSRKIGRVTEWDGNAKCIIQTKTVDIIPFKDVDEEIAKTEGEGDCSLRYWRSAHKRHFKQECKAIGRAF